MRRNKDKYVWWWGSNIYSIAKYLNDNNIRRVGVFVWEVHKNLQFLSSDKIFPWLININHFAPRPFESLQRQAYEDIVQQCSLSWSKGESCYILIGRDDHYYYNEMNLLKTVASDYKKKIVLEKEFISKGDKNLLYRIE